MKLKQETTLKLFQPVAANDIDLTRLTTTSSFRHRAVQVYRRANKASDPFMA